MPIIDVDIPNSREKGLILYAKGSYILSLIENEMGKENWKLLLKDLYKTYNGKIMTMDDFEEQLAKYDKTSKALSLFKELLSEKGMPEE